MPTNPLHIARPLLFIRHGATQPNLDGLRCGGDMDAPLSDTGRRQIAQAAQQILAMNFCVDVIVASDLSRVRESAALLSEALDGLPIVIQPHFKERLLGQWNLQPIEATEPLLRQGVTPPGGESNTVFTQRIQGALESLRNLKAYRCPLLVGSKGVARVLRESLGHGRQGGHHHPAARNAEILLFDLAFAPEAVQPCLEGIAS